MEDSHTAERIDAQLKLLHKLNLEWAQETAALLEDEVGLAQAPLQARVQELQALVLHLEHERDQLADKLSVVEETTDNRLRALGDKIGESIQEALGQDIPIRQLTSKPLPRRIPLSVPSKAPAINQIRRSVDPLKATKSLRKVVQPLKRAHVHPAAKPIASIAVLMLVGYLGTTQLPGRIAKLKFAVSTGQVAGISTSRESSPPIKSLAEEYPESLATVPLANTVYATYTDSDFGVSLEYPKNTTDIVHVVGGSNLWFLRGDGYLMKISKINAPASQSLDDWWNFNGDQYISDTPAAKKSFQNQPAYFLPSAEKSESSGSQYFIKVGAEVYLIWLKDEPATTDDGQRLEKMVNSLQFTTPS